jgi:hypothetical protein
MSRRSKAGGATLLLSARKDTKGWFWMPEQHGDVGEASEGAEATSKGAEGKARQKQASSEKPRRSHAERAMGNLRAAKRGQREVSDPVERARILLAEANVLALLEVADALAGGSGDEGEPTLEEPEPSE